MHRIKSIYYLFFQILKKTKWRIIFNIIYYRAIKNKECYYGPFLGEFGHLLGHNLPFISYLHSKGIKVNFCGLEMHKPFFYLNNKEMVTHSYIGVRDFFNQSLPDCNSAIA